MHHLTELGITSARRVFLAPKEAGVDATTARDQVRKAALISWRGDRQYAEVLTDTGLANLLTAAQFIGAIKEQLTASVQHFLDVTNRLDAIEGSSNLVDLSVLTNDKLGGFDAVFAPGGLAPPAFPRLVGPWAALRSKFIAPLDFRTDVYSPLLKPASKTAKL